MTVKELRELIQDLPDTETVSFQIDDGCCNDYLELTVAFTDIYDGKTDKFAAIRFEHIPGYRSCIQAGGTKRAHEEYWKDKPKRK